MKYDIVFATPAHHMVADYVVSLTETINELQRIGITWKFINSQSCYIRLARERIINLGEPVYFDNKSVFANQFDYNKIMWIDSDIIWNPEDVLKLYYSDRSIVCGRYRMLDGNYSVSIDGKNLARAEDIPKDGYIEVATSGFGFICVSKGVFESMDKPWFDSMILDHNGRKITAIGEDTSWCIKAREAGHRIYLDTSVLVGHKKEITIW